MKFKRLIAGGLAGAAVLTSGVLVPSGASADAISACPQGSFCAFDDTMYSGNMVATNFSVPDFPLARNGFYVRSYWNRTSYTVCAIRTDRRMIKAIVPGEQSALLGPEWSGRIDYVEAEGCH